MNTAKRFTLAISAGALLLIGAGVAVADDVETIGGGESTGSDTQSPTQVIDSVLSTIDNGNFQLMDALNGDNRPDGANGVESEFPPADPRFVEGPVGGLLNGPQD